jgi:cell shape-determining protein MreD
MHKYRTIRAAGAVWGIFGVALLLGSAIFRLAPFAVEALSFRLLWSHWIFLLIILLFMAYAEGYRAFQNGFSPRVAARARHILTRGRPVDAFLAPLFCMAYFHAPQRRRIVSISVTAGIVVLVLLVRLLPQPWRGLVDAGVIVGLAWGLVSLAVFGVQALTRDTFGYSPELPDKQARASQ